MKKVRLLVLMSVLTIGLAGLTYAGNTSEVTVTASVNTEASISPGTTSYAFGTGLDYGVDYQATTSLAFTNDGSVSETFTVKWNTGSNWNYADSGDMSAAPTGDDNSKIGGNWGATASDVTAMTLIKTTDGLQSTVVSASASKNLWLGLWTPASLSSSSKANGQVILTVTATAE